MALAEAIVTAPVIPVMAAQTTTSGNDTDTYSETFTNVMWRGARFYVKRTADTGTCTMDVYLQGEDPANAGSYVDVTGKIIAQFADGETGTYVGIVYPGITAQDTGTDSITTTSGAKVDATSAYLPWHWRLRVRSGGTGVTNTFSVSAEMLK